MFADVIPLLRMPRNTSTFTYRIPSQLEGMLVIGTIVRVPWRGKELFAIVESISENSTIRRTAEIIDRVETTPSWSKERLDALKQQAQRQCTSFATLAAAFTPDIPKRNAPVPSNPFTASPAPAFLLKTADIEPLRAIAQDTSITHVQIASQAERLFLYTSWVLQNTKQTLILTPTLFDAHEIASFLTHSTKKRVCVWGGVLAKNPRWKQWCDIRDDQYDIVVATRSGVCVPLRALGSIIIDQTEDQDHRSWEGAPYLDAREIAHALAISLAIPCRHTSMWPRAEDSIHPTWQTTPAQLPGTHTVIHQSNQGLLHHTIETALENCLARDGQVLIISSQISAARAFLCLDCQYRWHCQVCGSSLQERTKELTCDTCGHVEIKPDACPRCTSTRMQGFALGLETLERELPKLFHVPVLRITDTQPPTARGILLATPYAWRRWAHLQKARIQTVLLFHPEKILFSPDYRAQEWFAHFLTWHRIMINDYLHAPMYIQTGLEEGHPLLDIVLQRDIPAFLALELPARKRMSLPPYGESLLVTTAVHDQEELRALGARLRQDFPNRVYGSVTNRKSQATSWLIKLSAENMGELDKLNDSIYSKTLLYRNPETPLLS